MTIAGSYVAAAVLLVDPAGRVLLFLRDDKPAIPFPSCWDMVGGRVEPGEPVVAAARRAVLAECGYAVGDLLFYDVAAMKNGYGGAAYELHVFYALVRVPLEDLRLSADAGQALRFVAPEELDALPLADNGRVVRDFFASPQYREMMQRVAKPDAPSEPSAATPEAHQALVIQRMRESLAAGTPWHRAVLAAVAEWQAPDETLPDGRYYCYLTGGEAFDWVLLADRLCEELDGALPQDELEALLFNGMLPEDLSEEEFRGLIGPDKYSAHLNYLYGVRVEEALQLAIQDAVDKERRSGIWRSDPMDSVYERIYSKDYAELRQMFHEETSAAVTGDTASLADLRAFMYWLFKFRVRRSEPARIASDTRKGIAQLTRLELVRRSSPLFADLESTGTFIEATARVR